METATEGTETDEQKTEAGPDQETDEQRMETKGACEIYAASCSLDMWNGLVMRVRRRQQEMV
jgi:hypothetical protein